jgi:hypothetical protein
LVLINGGAAIAILTFLGGVASKERIDFVKVGVVADTLKWFAFGVALAVLGMAFAYLTNFAMFHIVAICAAIISLGLFVGGMFAASDAITHLLSK